MEFTEADAAIFCLPGLTLEQRLTVASLGWKAERILSLDAASLRDATGLRIAFRWSACGAKSHWDTLRRWLDTGNGGNQAVCYRESTYPPALRTIADPPYALTYMGTLEGGADWSVSIVGTRNPTEPALQAAFSLALEAADAHTLVISGFARGIDRSAHRGSVAMHQPTWAVLGSGLARVDPSKDRLIGDVISCTGALLSEFHPDSPALGWHFPLRNRLIAALSPVTVVVQAPLRSGALSTADHALRQGRDVAVHRAGMYGSAGAGSARLADEGAPVIDAFHDIGAMTGTHYPEGRRVRSVERHAHTGEDAIRFGSRRYRLI